MVKWFIVIKQQQEAGNEGDREKTNPETDIYKILFLLIDAQVSFNILTIYHHILKTWEKIIDFKYLSPDE